MAKASTSDQSKWCLSCQCRIRIFLISRLSIICSLSANVEPVDEAILQIVRRTFLSSGKIWAPWSSCWTQPSSPSRTILVESKDLYHFPFSAWIQPSPGHHQLRMQSTSLFLLQCKLYSLSKFYMHIHLMLGVYSNFAVAWPSLTMTRGSQVGCSRLYFFP